MANNSYPIELKPASKNGWFTPAESNGYYKTKYARDGVTVRWWGDGTGASNHDNIVNYMNQQAAAGIKSVNYVLSDNKITQCVDPDNVAWASNAGNPTTISVETQPTLGDEGYKKWGWLLSQLEKQYQKTLKLYRHSDWFSTECPGTIDLTRIRQEADKWNSGTYDGGNMASALDIGKALYHVGLGREPESQAAATSLGQRFQADPVATMESLKASKEWADREAMILNYPTLSKRIADLQGQGSGVEKQLLAEIEAVVAKYQQAAA